MSTIKTAISIQQTLYEEAEAAAKELHLSRSNLYALAVEQFLRQYKSRKLRENLNQVYQNEPSPEEQQFQEQMEKELGTLWAGESW